MSIRRRSERRIYVEDSLPRFLRTGPAVSPPSPPPATPIAQALPRPVSVPVSIPTQTTSKPTPLATQPMPPAPVTESQSRALVVMPQRTGFSLAGDGWFFVRLITLAVALNLALIWLLSPQPDHWQSKQRLQLKAYLPASPPTDDTLEERVLTYSRPPMPSQEATP